MAASAIFEAGLVELQCAGVLRDDADGRVGVAVLVDRLDLDGDLKFHALRGGKVLDYLLVQVVEIRPKRSGLRRTVP